MISKSNLSIIIFLLITVALFASVEGEQAHHFDWSGFLGSVMDIINRDKNLGKVSHQFKELQDRLDKIEREVQQIKDISRKKGEDEGKRIEELGKKECQKKG
jgi:hypothetical protein